MEYKQSPALPQYKALSLLAMLFVTISLSTFILGYKVITIHHTIFSAAALVIPIRYMLGDVIAEVYGFYIAKKYIWYMVICGISFAAIITVAIHLPSPTFWDHQAQYNTVLGRTMRIAVDATVGVILGSMLNVYLLTKWKVLVSGRLFILRSLGSSVIGELTQYIVVLIMMYYNLLTWRQIFELIIVDYAIQVVFLFISTPFAHLLVSLLKRIEGREVTDQTIVFNPFILSDQLPPSVHAKPTE